MLAAHAAGVAALSLAGTGALASSPARPDLVETAVSVSAHGRSLRVTDTVRNRGAATASRSTTRYYLGRLRIGVRSVGRLSPGARARGSQRLRIPSSLPSGSYHLLACADARKRIRESNERNNCRAAPQPVAVRDSTPPLFAGLKRATTCIPGPAGGEVRYSHYYLQWDPASDDVTPTGQLVYSVYQTNAPGGETLSRPTYTTSAGATSFTTPLLPDDRSYYFLVRVTDRAGNQDSNRLERFGMNLCV
jgi:hypothetical protein